MRVGNQNLIVGFGVHLHEDFTFTGRIMYEKYSKNTIVSFEVFYVEKSKTYKPSSEFGGYMSTKCVEKYRWYPSCAFKFMDIAVTTIVNCGE